MRRDCAVCGGRDRTVVFEQKFVRLNSSGPIAEYDVVVCRECDFAFADGIPSQLELDEYYRASTKTEYDLSVRLATGTAVHVEDEHVVRQHRHSVENILRFLRSGDQVLDVGCGSGHLLSLLRGAGVGGLAGLDPSPVMSEVARMRYGIQVQVGSLSEELKIRAYDFVILSHVLEHVVDLQRFLVLVRRTMAPEARLYLEVPDAWAFSLSADSERPLCGAHEHDIFVHFTPEHVNFFTPVSLENLMCSAGFEKISLESQVSTMGIIASVWRRVPYVRDPRVLPALSEYVVRSRSVVLDALSVLRNSFGSGREIVIWGAGLHTQRLLALLELAEARIHAFVDSNPSYHGQQLFGRPILSPAKLSELPALPILVSSRRFQEEIRRQIGASGLPNEVILLYPTALTAGAEAPEEG